MKTTVRTFLLIGLLILGSSSVSQAQEESPQANLKITECVKKGDVACVSEFLAQSGNAKAVDDDGVPLLVIAAEKKSTPLVRLLINAGADVNDKGEGDAPPLCRAAFFGRKEIAETLLEAGAKADVICEGDHGGSVLMDAVYGAMAKEIPIPLGETVSSDAELYASLGSRDDYLAIVRMLLARGVDVNVVAKCDFGESALIYAAMAADVTIVKMLLTHGADVSKQPNIMYFLRDIEREYQRSKSTLVPAMSREQKAMLDWFEKTISQRQEIERLLKSLGAKDPERDQEETDSKMDAEDYARESFDSVIERDDQKDFERLVAAYINHPLGATLLPNALRVAVIYSRVEMVKLLLKSGVSPNPPSNTYTPLMYAASSADIELVKLLVGGGADINAEDDKGHTALDAVESYSESSEEHRAVAVFLKERGARRGSGSR